MFNPLKPLAAAALVALAAPAAAQESTTGETSQSTADQMLDMGQDVAQDGPKPGERYSREKHGDWDMACVKTESGEDPCSMLQMLNAEDGSPMAEVSMFRIDQDGGQAVAGATIIVPLETLLPAALTVSIDNAPGKRYNYTFCNPVGCVAQIGLTQGDVDAMKKGKQATLAIRPAQAPDQLIELTMSLKGFTAAYDAVDIVEQ
jgi:invasion protein IalB